MVSLSQQSIEMELPLEPHSAIIAGMTDCGKTKFVLDLLEKQYRDAFANIIILCPTVARNQTYLSRSWLWHGPRSSNVHIVDPRERLHDYLRVLYGIFAGQPTLYLIDDMAASKALTKKKDMLSELAFSGRHAQQSVWVLTQRYNAVLKDLREQTKWVALFHCKDRDSFEDCLRENDIVPASEHAVLRAQLAATKHSKLLLKTSQPAAYKIA
jgi:Poxvirus A32 protein